MKITRKTETKMTKKFQQGGPVDAPVDETEAPVSQEEVPEETPAEEQGQQQDPMMQLAQIFAQGLQNQDCNMLAQGAQMFLQLLEQAQGGGEQAPEGEPVFKKGGKLAYRIKK